MILKSDLSKGFVVDGLFRRLRPLWRDFGGAANGLPELRFDPALSESDIAVLRQWIKVCLSEGGSAVAVRDYTVQLGRSFLELNPEGRKRFLLTLAEHAAIQPEWVEVAYQRWKTAPPEERAAAEAALRDALETPSIKLLARFNGLPAGVKFLVDMRAELLRLKREEPALISLEAELKRLLRTWFDIGLLQLEQITWRSSAELLEKLIIYEAVHEINGWDDLKNRLEADRRCFAFFHANMPNEPLIFVEVALVKGLSGNIGELLDQNAPLVPVQDADTAIFYSISNTQAGLAGISLGDFLIKRVVATLKKELPWLKTFSTLSPIPGFSVWLQQQSASSLQQISGHEGVHEQAQAWAQQQPAATAIDAELGLPLSRLVAHYLVQEKNKRGLALDPVANFHLSNGAQIRRVNWLADASAKGMQQSLGFMVNYIYEPDFIEERSKDYSERKLISISSDVRRLIKSL